MALKKLYSGKFLQPAIHVVFWGLVIISPYLFRNPNTYSGFSNWHFKLMLNNTVLAGMFYLNAYWLYPVLYKRRGLLIYIVSLVLLVAGALFLSRYTDKLLFPRLNRARMGHFEPGMQRPHMQSFERPDSLHSADVIVRHPDSLHYRRLRLMPDRRGFDRGWFGWYFTNIITYIFILGISISYRIIRDNARLEKARHEKANENLKTELSFLRSQVSPHFIFNILNNMVSLARKKSDLLEPSLIELSKLMRYMLYENDDERVLLSREVEYLESYIALQKLRFGDDVTIVFNHPDQLNASYIEPMLLAPFVENAFKHGVGLVDDPHIDIALDIDQNGWLDFKVMNSVAPPQDSKDKDSGIGLANVKRRLELLYHDEQHLEILHNEEVFIAHLRIKLK